MKLNKSPNFNESINRWRIDTGYVGIHCENLLIILIENALSETQVRPPLTYQIIIIKIILRDIKTHREEAKKRNRQR